MAATVKLSDYDHCRHCPIVVSLLFSVPLLSPRPSTTAAIATMVATATTATVIKITFTTIIVAVTTVVIEISLVTQIIAMRASPGWPRAMLGDNLRWLTMRDETVDDDEIDFE